MNKPCHRPAVAAGLITACARGWWHGLHEGAPGSTGAFIDSDAGAEADTTP